MSPFLLMHSDGTAEAVSVAGGTRRAKWQCTESILSCQFGIINPWNLKGGGF